MIENLLLPVRIYAIEYGVEKLIDSYLGIAIPRVGDIICNMYDKYEVIDVEWTIIDNQPHVDVFCGEKT